MEGEQTRLCAVLQAAAFEYDAAGGTVDNNNNSSDASVALSAGVLSDLHDICQSCDTASADIAGLWDELAERKISASGVVRMLTGTMAAGGPMGVKAADVYLWLLLFPGWPVYSLFSQMAFDSLARCVRNACRGTTTAGAGVAQAPLGGRKGGRKGKRARETQKQFVGGEGEAEVGQNGPRAEGNEAVGVESIQSLMLKLENCALVLHLRERQETLKLLIGLLVDVMHLVSDIKDVEMSRSEVGGRGKRRAGGGEWSGGVSVPDIVFSTLGRLMGPVHGHPVNTAILVLRALTPTVLLAHPNGTGRAEVRSKAIHFITRTLLADEFVSARPAVVAFPRYVCFKAPEKTDGRCLAVESAVDILRASNSSELCRFAGFLSKFSRSKPRHRLVAIDVSLALLGGFPNPLHPEALPNHPGPESSGAHAGHTRAGEFETEAGPEPGIDADLGVDKDVQPDDTPGHVHRDSGDDAHAQQVRWWGITCCEILLQRCSDKVPAIRARALANLAQAVDLLSVNPGSRRHLQGILGINGSVSHGSGPNLRVHPSRLFSAYDTPVIGGETPSAEPGSDLPGATPLTPAAGPRDLWSLLQRRCVDDKAAVRKSAFLLMKKSTTLIGKPPEDPMLHAMGAACGDSMISIRKAALSALSEVMRRFPGDARVTREWLKCALPLAFDNEQSLQDECQTTFEELVLDRITLISTLSLPRANFRGLGNNEASAAQDLGHERSVERLLPVGAMNLLREMADGSSISALVKRISSSLGKKKRVRPGVALALQNLISAHRSPDGAWFLLSEVTAFVPKAVGWEFLRAHWKHFDKKDDNPHTHQQRREQTAGHSDGEAACGNMAAWASNRVHLLQTISNVAVELPSDAAAELATELLDRLKAFDMHPAEVGAHIKALAILCRRKAVTAAEGDQLVVHWVKELLEQAGTLLQSSLSPSLSGTDEVFTTPKTTNPRSNTTGTQTRSRTKQGHHGGGKAAAPQQEKGSSTHIVTVIFTIGSLALICPQVKASNVVTLLQTLLTPAKGLVGRRRGEAERILLTEKVTPEIEVHVRVALGKLCLADDNLAKRCLPLFVHELARADMAAVRNNIMIIVSDFCVRYTALTDEYIHDLTRALRDPCDLVRRQAFVLLSRLLQRDYVKGRGMLFHRFLLALVDDSEKIRQLAAYVFGSVLKTKAPLLAYNSFVEAIFVLNDCVSQASSSALLQFPEKERSLFCLRGEVDAVVEKRMTIYATLLQQMLPEHLLATSAKLCVEILAAAADGLLDLHDGPSKSVLKDALRILASKDLRLSGNRAAAGASDLEEEEGAGGGGGAAATLAAVKGRVVTQLMKKNLVQNAVPIFIELKRMLESSNSPLLGLLMECIRTMLKDYKHEIEEILVADKQLQKEILYDMQKHDAAKARAKVSAAAAAIPSMHREALHPVVTPNSSLHVRSVSAPQRAAAKAAAARVTTPAVPRPPTSGGKENVSPSPGLTSSASLPPHFPRASVLKSSSLNSTQRAPSIQSPLGDGAQRSHTPRIRIYSASEMSRLQSRDSHETPPARPPHPHPHPHASQLRHTTPPMATAAAALATPSQSEEELSSDSCLAGAVADVAAATTVATVLHQVAHKTVTPLRSMSIPRLRRDGSTPAPGGPGPGALSLGQLQRSSMAAIATAAQQAGLEAIRRRQSFSDVDEPCGVLSQSSDASSFH